MARRMFSPDIVESDAFLDMPPSTQALYFHLGMSSDDDGFVQPKRVMRLIGAAEDDLKILLAKRFVLAFQSGVVVIKHWLIHNLIRADLYKETQYKNEKKELGLNENGAYTELRDGVSELKQLEAPKWLKIRRKEQRTANVPQTVHRIGKDRIGKDINTTASGEGKEINEIIFLFKEVNPLIEKLYGRAGERKAIERMLKAFGREKLEGFIMALPKMNGQKYWPKSTTPVQLENNIPVYMAKKSELETKQAERKIKAVILQ